MDKKSLNKIIKTSRRKRPYCNQTTWKVFFCKHLLPASPHVDYLIVKGNQNFHAYKILRAHGPYRVELYNVTESRSTRFYDKEYFKNGHVLRFFELSFLKMVNICRKDLKKKKIF